MFVGNCLKTLHLDPRKGVWFSSLFQPKLCRLSGRHLNRSINLSSSSVFHLLEWRNFLKMYTSSSAFSSLWGHTNSQASVKIPNPFFLCCCSCSLWPLALLFHTAVYYFDQYPPFPLHPLPLSLFLWFSPPKLTWHITHPLPEACMGRQHGREGTVFREVRILFGIPH